MTANRFPIIVPFYNLEAVSGLRALANLEVSLRRFECGKILEAKHDFNTSESLIHDPKNSLRLDSKLKNMFTLTVTNISCAEDFEANRELFSNAMEVYASCIKDDAERDTPENIERWIGSRSRVRPAFSNDRSNWFDSLTILDRRGRAHGAFWANIDRRNGLGVVTFWGMRAGQRSENIAIRLVKEAKDGITRELKTIEGAKPLQALFFDVDPVDPSYFQSLVSGARELYALVTEDADEASIRTLESEIHPASGKPYLLTYLENYIQDKKAAKLLSESLKRYRRLTLYCRAGILTEDGWEVKAFVVSEDDGKEVNSSFATYFQPPIVEGPDDDGTACVDDCRELCLFALVSPGFQVPGIEAMAWEQNCFYGDQYSVGKETEIRGWSQLMDGGFSQENLSRFEHARLKAPRLGRRYEAAAAVYGVIGPISRSGSGHSPFGDFDITL